MAKRSNGNGNGRRGQSPRGTLISIGGHEDRDGNPLILKAVAERAKGGKLVVATLASREPDEMFQDYRKAFSALGVKRIEHLNVRDRETVLKTPPLGLISGASVVFFTGGGQLRITTQFGGTPIC